MFRAKAKGGVTPIEATKRFDAVVKAKAGAAPTLSELLPPAMPHFGGVQEIPQPVEVIEAAKAGQSDGCGSIAPLGPPRIKITIEGPPRSGKSVITHVIAATLSHEGIASIIRDELRSIRWAGRGGALDNLIQRGLTVEIVRRETAVEAVPEAPE